MVYINDSKKYIDLYTVLLIFILTAVYLYLPQEALAAQNVNHTLVLGMEKISDEGIPSAKKSAVKTTKINAIHTTLLEILTEKTYTDEFKRINELFFIDPEPFVDEYRLIVENSSLGIFKILAEVDISKEKIKQALIEAQIILPVQELPKILFLISEKKMNDLVHRYWWTMENAWFSSDAETALSHIFSNKGFTVLDHILSTKSNEEIQKVSETESLNCETIDTGPFPQLNDIIRIGSDMNADVVIVGSSQTEAVQNSTGKFSCKGQLELNVVIIKTAEVTGPYKNMISAFGNDDGICQSEVLQKAAFEISGNMIRDITDLWQVETEKSHNINFIVKGAGYLANFVAFRKELRKHKDITNVITKEMNSDEAHLEINSKIDGMELSGELVLTSFPNFSINIIEAEENFILMKIMPK